VDGMLCHLCPAHCIWLTVDLAGWLGQKAAHALQSGERDPRAATLGQSENYLQTAMHYSLHGVPDTAVGMFLDAACVLCGRPEADMLLAWRQWHGDDASSFLVLLKSRHLVRTDADGRLQVHDVLRWFGRRVVLGKANGGKDAGLEGSRLWVQDGRVAGHDPQVCVLSVLH
jgi:hypothetical protein